ncbi:MULTISPECIES: hypothetical protein [Actinomadura]|uniref:Uncharacterized protein n=1 Tax=Actinomadura yumaensis TaxID=111807 RepID=A0ABW2CF76_9ACTN|nr:hypothetical protein [Actinomadura sp. J1-007]MWK34601.1 hypothetical protein [Actinomadura sp. J1-007]
MSHHSPRHARVSADQPMPDDGRRSYLSALEAAVGEHGGMSCGVVPREGTPVLHVINAELPGRWVEVGCDYVDGAWWFVWDCTGQTIGTVDDSAGVARVVGVEVGAHVRRVSR